MTTAPAPTPGVSRWWALGTYVHLAVEDAGALPTAEAAAREVLERVDHRCSRFRPDSDLVRANAAAGRWVRVDPWLAAAVGVALEAAAETDGLVDPTLGSVLSASGYDRDLALLPTAATTPTAAAPVRRAVPAASHRGAWSEVGVAPDAVRVPAGCALDLGATGKAWAADLVARVVVELTGAGVLVSLGGDVRVDGPGDGAVAWPVAVGEDPADLGDAEVVLVTSGGVATSGTRRRRWQHEGTDRHHLLDPRTGTSAQGPWRTVSALGDTCVAANTATTAALVVGAGARAWLDRHHVSARLVGHDGVVVRTAWWPHPSSDPSSDPRRSP